MKKNSTTLYPPGGGSSIEVQPPALESMERKGWTKEPPKASGKKAAASAGADADETKD